MCRTRVSKILQRSEARSDMQDKITVAVLCTVVVFSLPGCVYTSRVTFPDPDDIFVTTGDGNIEKPYTPVGQLLFIKEGYRLPFPIFGLLPIADVDPSATFRQEIVQRVRQQGGDGVINLRLDWTPPDNGYLGLGADGGRVAIYGTIIRR